MIKARYGKWWQMKEVRGVDWEVMAPQLEVIMGSPSKTTPRKMIMTMEIHSLQYNMDKFNPLVYFIWMILQFIIC